MDDHAPATTRDRASNGSATVVYVTFGTRSLDLTWIPTGTEILIVHNDRTLDPAQYPTASHIVNQSNVGFGAAVNQAASRATGERLVLVNPDTTLGPEHWSAFVQATPDEVVTIPLNQPDGTPTSIVNPYPTTLSLLATAWRLGRTLDAQRRIRRRVGFLLGGYLRKHSVLLAKPVGSWPLRDHWVSGGVLSVDRQRFLAIGGFDSSFFLYLEDADLCRRLVGIYPDMRCRVAATVPAIHTVGGSASPTVDQLYLESVSTWFRREKSWRSAVALFALSVRRWWLGREGLPSIAFLRDRRPCG